jgi:hypothetical protein
MALGNMKGLFLAIAQNHNPDLHESQVSDDEWQATVMDATEEPGTHFAGHYLMCWATKTWTKARSPFTPVTFGPHAPPDLPNAAEEGQPRGQGEEGADQDPAGMY